MSFFSNLFKSKQQNSQVLLVSPIKGKYVPLENVSDPVFASKSMGQGFATRFNEDSGVVSVFSPISGTIDNIFPTKHAIGIISSDKKSNILIHMGIDTVTLDGKGFEVFVNEKSKINAGDLIAKINLDVLKEKNLISDIMVLVLPDSEKLNISPISELNAEQSVEVNEALFEVH